MSFLNYSLTHKSKNLNYRKENRDSHKTIHFPRIYYIKRERASAFTSKGSMTLEAAVVVPIFFFAMLCLAYLLEMMAIQTTVRNAIYSTGRELAQQVYDRPVITIQEVEQKVIKNMRVEILENSIIFAGTEEVSCEDSTCSLHTGILNLSVKYKVRIPFMMFRIPILVREETLRVKGWNGYAPGGFDYGSESVVYMTEAGLVYHNTPDCTYLDMSVIGVKKDGVEDLRNSSGAKYYACESCGEKENAEEVYVTSHGSRYHASLECKKIKRNVYAVSREEVYGVGGCSKCVK